tara:strand:- start:960 stop:1676 length:717 start_codon:yes stop_codon:yes gene_type:complete
MFIGTLGYIDPRIINTMFKWIIFNVPYFFNVLYVFESSACACLFCLDSIKSYIVFYFKRSKKDLLIAHIKKDGGYIEEYTSTVTQYPTKFNILFYGHLNTLDNTFTRTIYMQRLTTIPRKKPTYTLSTIKLHAINIRLLKNNECYASYPVALTTNTNNMLFNYLITDNILFDRAFVQYWLKTYRAIVIKDNQDYDVHILDKNIEEITLTAGSYIKLTHDNYIICKENDVPIDYEPVEL